MTRTAADIGRGLAPARVALPVPAGQRIHVVGAAGAGASAAALLAQACGARVSGCDPGGPSPYTAPLEAADIPLAWEHAPDHVVDAAGAPRIDRLAVTKALTSIEPDHPELAAARAAGIVPEPWQQVVADAAASHGGRLVAVAGTHGKSTSAGWLVQVLAGAGRDPSTFVGALLPATLTGGLPATARWGSGDTFIVEADEYAGNFDPYRPEVAVLLNAEWDHPDVFADERAVLDAFEAWLTQPGARSRAAVVNVGDRGGAALAERLHGELQQVVRVALDPTTERAEITGVLGADGRLRIAFGGARIVEARLTVPGRHNAANAVCVAAAAWLLGVPTEEIATGLRDFAGVGRRLEFKGEPRGVAIYDDYGHHPTAIAATLAALRDRHPGRRLWAVYEPLTFHRTAAMLDGFADVLATADRVLIADIWPGRDPDRSIASAAGLAEAVAEREAAPAAASGSVEVTADLLASQVEPGDVVLVMGGGRSHVIAQRLLERLSAHADG
jgi:UDP-N-acetylmuramate--alanine ligase